MSALTLTLLSLAIAASALALVAAANHRHQQLVARRRRALHMRRRLAELEEMALAVEPVVESLAIPILINEENLSLAHRALREEPDSEALVAHLQRAEELAQDLSDVTRPRQLSRLLESDSTIARTRYYINQSVRLLRRLQTDDVLSREELDQFVEELTWAHLMVMVISMIGHGHKATNDGNSLLAFAYYRKAQQALIDSMNPDSRRHEMIRQLADVMSGNALSLSPSLMPETAYNPPPRKTERSA